MLSDRLKEETKKSHQALDSFLVVKIKAVKTIDEYISILQAFYYYFDNVEVLINRYVNNYIIPGFNERRKAAVILQDLYEMNSKTEKLVKPPAVPVISDVYDALGAMYVSEGSTLGGKIITKIISGNLQIPDTSGFNFFNGYKENTAVMWKEFKSSLDNFTKDRFEENKIINAASETFKNFEEWVKLVL